MHLASRLSQDSFSKVIPLNRPDLRSYREPCPAGAGWPDPWSAYFCVLDLGRGLHVELAVEALVVPPPHLLEGRELDLLDSPPGASLSDEFGLVEVVEGLGEGVVVAVANGSGGGDCAEFDDPAMQTIAIQFEPEGPSDASDH